MLGLLEVVQHRLHNLINVWKCEFLPNTGEAVSQFLEQLQSPVGADKHSANGWAAGAWQHVGYSPEIDCIDRK